MSIRSTIRSFLAAGILLLFSFSITPKVYLHAIFADHEDVAVKVVQTEEARLGVGGFSCDINDQVATSPFTGSFFHLQIKHTPVFPTPATQHLNTSLRLRAESGCDMRGPPARS